MNFDEKKLKDIKSIHFNVNDLDYVKGDIDNFIYQEAYTGGFEMERDRLVVFFTDGVNRAKLYIYSNNVDGRNVLRDLLISNKENISLEAFPNLKLRYFKS